MAATSAMKRAFLIHLPGARLQLLPELKKVGIEVVFFTTSDRPRPEQYEVLAPGVPHVTNAHALSTRSPLFEGSAPARLQDIEKLAGTESVALHCFDRSNAAKRSIHDLHSIYIQHVGVWRTQLERFNPDVVIFTDNPHHGWDNVLYDLCRADGRTIAIIGYSELEQRVILKGSIDDIPGPTAEEIDGLVSGDEPVVDIGRDKLNLGNNERINNLTRIRRKASLLGAARLLVGWRQFGRTPPMGLLFFGNETPRHFEVRWTKFRNRLAGRELLKSYDLLASPADLDAPYVYFPLPMQPESTTVPLAGHFSEQVNLAHTVAAALPAGWGLYVKEHPAQILWTLSSRGRSVRHYEQLAAIPNVTIVKLETNSAHLVSHARAVATATGTTGFEAIEMGVPALIFGAPWYAKAPGVVRVQTVEECRDALSRIALGELKPDPRRVRVYKHLMKTKYSVQAIFDPDTAERDDLAPDVTAANLSAAIREVVDRRKPKPSGKRTA